MPKFADIQQYTRPSFYKVNVGWNYLEAHLADWMHPSAGAALDLEPDFQRAHVWNDEKRRRYVEFILRGGRSGKELLFNCVGWHQDYRGPFVIVDGKQRLEAARRFLRNELSIFGGNYFRDYTDPLRLTHSDFIVHVNNLETRAEVLQWYLEVNDGGVAHTKAELNRVRGLLEKETLRKKQ